MAHLEPKHKWSPDIWSSTIGPQLICPSGQTVPNQFSPQTFGPNRQMVPRIFCLSRGTGCGDLEIQRPNWLGTICQGGPNFGVCPWGPNLLRTICPGGSMLWGSFVQGDRKWGPGSLRIKWVQNRMCSSQVCLLEHLNIEKNLAILVLCGHARLSSGTGCGDPDIY